MAASAAAKIGETFELWELPSLGEDIVELALATRRALFLSNINCCGTFRLDIDSRLDLTALPS